jgi:hypothetical protein
MNSQELRNLQEAYMEVYELMERNEEPYIIDVKKSKRNPQKVEQQKTTHRKVEQNPSFFGGKKFGSLTGKMSKSPRNQKEELDLYDIILSHLLDEGYADTEQAAEAIMVNMSEDWRESIMERREHDEPGEDDRNPDVRSHNRAVGYKSKPKQKYGSYDKRDRGGSEEDHEKSLGLQNLIRSVQGGSK